jgi:hypothetical protein
MATTKHLYDPRCYELAELVLGGLERQPDQATFERHADLLAQDIQVTIDNYVEDLLSGAKDNPREKGDDDGVEYADPRDYRDGIE